MNASVSVDEAVRVLLIMAACGLGASSHAADRQASGTSTAGDGQAWTQTAKRTAQDGEAWDAFGTAVAISGDTAFAGANGDDDLGSGSGAAYVFGRDMGGEDAWGQVRKLTAADGAAGDEFGGCVAADGDMAICGAQYDDDKGSNSGSAYVFMRNQGGADNWGQVRKLTAADGVAADYFGNAVAMSSETVLVAARGDDDKGVDSGSAYVFMRNQGGADTWGQVAKLTAADGAADDRFGQCVAVDGEVAAVGAQSDDDNGSGSGSAHVFLRNQGGTDAWGQAAKLIPADGSALDSFGYSIAVDGDTVVVGALYDDEAQADQGSAYVFERDAGGAGNWGQVAKLLAADAAANDRFGYWVAVDGDTIAVGAYQRDDHGADSGAVYLFARDEGGADAWGQVAKINAADAADADYFGWTVDLSGNTLAVGAPQDDDLGNISGSIYLFEASANSLPIVADGQTPRPGTPTGSGLRLAWGRTGSCR